MMPLDECVGYPTGREYAEHSVKLTYDWALKCQKTYEQELARREKESKKNFLFGIVQGANFCDLRRESAKMLTELDFAGYAIGGLSVGEPRDNTWECLYVQTEILPENKPRYFMGLGEPTDILEAVDRGVDMFDCVLPTRNGRNGQAFTRRGKLNIKNAAYKLDFHPIEENCNCPVCRKYSRAYINHLFNSGELLALRLLSWHNLYFMAKFMADIRQAIAADNFHFFKENFIAGEREYAEKKI
jgi:queuine tRNA-ribosyltransferase